MLHNNTKSRIPVVRSPFIYTLQLIGPISWMHSWENNAVFCQCCEHQIHKDTKLAWLTDVCNTVNTYC